jgi:putative endonuclease
MRERVFEMFRGRRSGQAHPGRMFFVYIMASQSRALHTGVTNSLIQRVREHKEDEDGFGAKFDRLVYFERFEELRAAVGREERIRGWLRSKKATLVAAVNPEWNDLSCEWFEQREYWVEEVGALFEAEAAEGSMGLVGVADWEKSKA